MMTDDARRPIADFAAAPDAPFQVLLDDDGGPAGLVGPDGPGPAVVVAADTPLAVVLHARSVLEALLDGAGGVVLVDPAGRPVGVVAAGRLRAELTRDLAEPYELGDDQPLGLRHALPPPVRIPCDVCGRTNVFDRFQQTVTYRCQHGDHDFRPRWKTAP